MPISDKKAKDLGLTGLFISYIIYCSVVYNVKCMDEKTVKKLLGNKYLEKRFFEGVRKNSFIFGDVDQEQVKTKIFSRLREGKYHFEKPFKYLYRPKEGGVLRILPCFGVRDYYTLFCIVYFLFEDYLIENRVPNTFGPHRESKDLLRVENKERKEETESLSQPEYSWEYELEPEICNKAFVDYKRILAQHVYGTESGIERKRFYLKVDLANFYDSVNISLLRRKVEESLSGNAEVKEMLFKFLSNWKKGERSDHSVGLPIDIIGCSRLLAHFYLLEYDKRVKDWCDKNDCVYLRVSDDQYFLSNNESALQGLIPRLSVLLGEFDLKINSQKMVLGCSDKLAEEIKVFVEYTREWDVDAEDGHLSVTSLDREKTEEESFCELLENLNKKNKKSKKNVLKIFKYILSLHGKKGAKFDKNKLIGFFVDKRDALEEMNFIDMLDLRVIKALISLSKGMKEYDTVVSIFKSYVISSYNTYKLYSIASSDDIGDLNNLAQKRIRLVEGTIEI